MSTAVLKDPVVLKDEIIGMYLVSIAVFCLCSLWGKDIGTLKWGREVLKKKAEVFSLMSLHTWEMG